MKINRTSEPTRVERLQPNKGGTAGASSAGTQAAKGGGAPVQAAGASLRLSQLETQFSQSGFDAGKVSEIRNAITDGRYQVDAGAVADKLLASAAQLAGRKV
jgi:negative regulator of flagellin synthesis FlgM